MKKTALEIYALAVCLFAVILFVVCSGIAVYSTIQISNPEFTMRSWTYQMYRSNDVYWDRQTRYRDRDGKATARPDEVELTRQRTEAFAEEVMVEKRDGMQYLVKSLIVLILGIVVFLIHWALARKARSTI
ncbi:MAG: hypothetical protein ABL891_11985 [Burkholderiales bacterium]